MAPQLSSTENCHHYLPVTDEILQSVAYVTSAGRGRIAPGTPYPPQQHPALYHFNWAEGRTLPEFGFILITEGRGIFESLPTGKVAITAGQAFLLFPDVWHRYNPAPETGWTEKWVQFNGSYIHSLMDHKLITAEHAVLQLADPAPVSRNLDLLIDSVHGNPTVNSSHLSLLTLGVLATALNQLTGLSPDTPGNDPLVEAALDYIWTRSRNALCATEIASEIGVTRRTLERRMAASGHSIHDEIIQCRFSRAERLIRETDLPLKTIVDLSGFGSHENLRHTFITRTNLSPLAYRQHHHSAQRDNPPVSQSVGPNS
ncbi:MAG: AraC family transcriptional regulator [Luteolibacter sp.]